MIYVLDTDILSLLGHEDSHEAPRLRRRIVELPSTDAVVTTVVNYEEQIRGWIAALSHAKSSEAEIRIYARLLGHLATYRQMTVFGFEKTAAKIAEGFRQRRLKIGAMDL